MVDVSVITPVWNKSEVTHHFLFYNWQIYLSRPEVQFVIVDNGSMDNTPVTLAHWQKLMTNRLVIHTEPENTGFGPANNKGAELADGDTLIFLSNDVVALGDYVAIVQRELTKTPGDLLGAQLLDFDTGWNRFNDEVFPYLAGWCIACTQQTWQQLGGFDERYIPCDYEDLDLSLTARRQGITCRQIHLPLEHAFGQTAAQLEGGREAITLKNQKLFKEKWDL